MIGGHVGAFDEIQLLDLTELFDEKCRLFPGLEGPPVLPLSTDGQVQVQERIDREAFLIMTLLPCGWGSRLMLKRSFQ